MEESASTVEVSIPPNKGLATEWASDQKAFKFKSILSTSQSVFFSYRWLY